MRENLILVEFVWILTRIEYVFSIKRTSDLQNFNSIERVKPIMIAHSINHHRKGPRLVILNNLTHLHARVRDRASILTYSRIWASTIGVCQHSHRVHSFRLLPFSLVLSSPGMHSPLFLGPNLLEVERTVHGTNMDKSFQRRSKAIETIPTRMRVARASFAHIMARHHMIDLRLNVPICFSMGRRKPRLSKDAVFLKWNN